MAQAVDVVHGGPLEPDRAPDLTALKAETRAWLEQHGFTIGDAALWAEALTHGSTGMARNYERLEFVGDRVLGLAVAEWLYRHNPGAEGELAQRLNALVSRQTCAEVAREIGAPKHVRLGKQARDDGAHDSDNVLGDIMEAMLGANFIENGFGPTRDVVHVLWHSALAGRTGESKHPKSALQEWAAGNQRKPPEYAVVERSGPDHAAKFTVRVSVSNVGEVAASGPSKQDAETAAAQLFMERFG
ncbi:MAG: ribonuclease III [Croceibacterium sp.]